MDSIEEKRVYGDRAGAREVYVASSMGVVRVRVAGDTVGEFGLCERSNARDVAATATRVAIATDEDVQVCVLETGPDDGVADDEAGDEPTFEGTGFGEAVAVGYDGGDLVAADPDGTVACRSAGSDDWEPLEKETIATVRAIDGDLIGTDSGVYRVHDGGLDHVGLTDVRDVSRAGVPLAATEEGVYKLGNGWMELATGPFVAVAADPRTEPGQLARAHAVAEDGTIHTHTAANEWVETDGPSESIVAVGYGDAVYAVTADGSFLALEDDSNAGTDGDADAATNADANATDPQWRTHTIGVTGVTGLAVPPFADD